MGAAARASARAAERRRRELEREEKRATKLAELELAKLEVEIFENHIEVLLSAHKQCSPTANWQDLRAAEGPQEPVFDGRSEREARERLESYEPGLLDRMLGRGEKRRDELAQAVEEAKEEDRQRYAQQRDSYAEERVEFEETCQLAERVLQGDLQAYQEAVRQFEPFSDIVAIGESIRIEGSEPWYLEATLKAHADDVVPGEAKSLLASGKLSVKKMTKSRFFELYQDHVCSCVLRIARELFALLPALEIVFVHAETPLLNSQTGHIEDQTILSARIFNLMYELQTIQRPSASLLIGARAR